MVYHISYDLCESHKDYDALYKAIKDLGDWCHPVDSDSTWYVNTDLNVEIVRNRLKAVMDSDDKLIVSTATAPGAWYNLSDKVSQWFKKYLI